jgi:hypothetical protein
LYETTSSNVLPINTPEQFSPPLKYSNVNNKQRIPSLKLPNTSEFHSSQRQRKEAEENKSIPFVSWPDRARALGLRIPPEQQNITEAFVLDQGMNGFMFPPGWENITAAAATEFIRWRADVLKHHSLATQGNIHHGAAPREEIGRRHQHMQQERLRRAQLEHLRSLQREDVQPDEIRRGQEIWRPVLAVAQQRIIDNEIGGSRPQGYRWGRGGQRVGAQHLRHVHQQDMFPDGQPQPQNVNANLAAQTWRTFRHADQAAAPQNIRPAPPIPAPNPPVNGPPADQRAIDPDWLRNVSQAFGPEGVHQVQRENLRVMFSQTHPPPESAPAEPVNVGRRFFGIQPPSEAEDYAFNQELEARRRRNDETRRMHFEHMEEVEERIAARRAGREPRRASYPGLPGNAPAPRA